MKIVITCEKIESIELKWSSAILSLSDITSFDIDKWEIDDLIEMIGKDRVIESIGKSEVIKYFNIEEKED